MKIKLFMTLCFSVGAIMAAEPSHLTFAFENDLFAGSDANYTHGTKITYLHAEDKMPASLMRTLDITPALSLGERDTEGKPIGHRRWGITVGQNMYTPEDISNPNLNVTDRPWAGWLYAGLVLQRRGLALGVPTADHLEINLGVVGPASLAEKTQKLVHDIGNFQRPEGWDHQIKNEPVLLLQANRAYRIRLLKPRSTVFGQFAADFIPEAGFGLGNLTTYANLGVMTRFGFNMPAYFNPNTGSGGIRPSLLGGVSPIINSDGEEEWPKYSLYAFGGVNARGIAHNIFLDGNTFTDSHSVDKIPWVADIRAGLALSVSRHTFMLWHAYRTREFHGQRLPQRFGGLSYSCSF